MNAEPGNHGWMAAHADHTTTGDLVIRRWDVDDAPALHAAIVANVDHLRPRMPWIRLEPQTVEQRRTLIAGWTEAWASGGDLVCGVWRGDALVATAGLHYTRGWGDGPEIGYWVVADEQRKGIATRTSAALVDLALTDPANDAVYLANDLTNLASRRVPEKLGFLHLGTVVVLDPEKIAPADEGVHDHWRMARVDWEDRAT